MTYFSNAKINLGLTILGKRNDGYHNLSTLFYPLPFPACDILEVAVNRTNFMTLSGKEINGNLEDNTCMKAYALLKKDFPEIKNVHIHLHKVIPSGAGLGGGSSNGVFCLKALNEVFELNLDKEKLLSYALQLGSDCPFFIYNTPCIGTGRGENLTPLNDFSLKGYYLLLVFPKLFISTKEVFSKFNIKDKIEFDYTQLPHDPNKWKEILTNDLEEICFILYPQLKKIKENLYKHGAIYSSMTGSGSTMYGIFKNEVELDPEIFSHFEILKVPITE